jgi:RNA polymerase sigma-70 factor (ECF subfamily)
VNDQFRQRYRVEHEDLAQHESLPTQQETNPEQQFLRQLTHERLRDVMANLTSEQQQAVTLRFGQGLTHREVADIMDKSEGAVKLLQHRALRAMRRLLDPKMD